MTDSAPPEDASPPDHAARPTASRWATLWGLLKRFRWPAAVAAVVVLAFLALALVQLPTIWQAIVTIASVGAVLSGLAGYWSTYHAVKRSVPLPASTKAPVGASGLSLMVLPFQNLTGDAGQAYIADGLTASQTADLSRIRDAFIVDAATVFTYKDKPATAQQVGNDLGVRFVLHGSVQRSGTKIRINAQLADATSNAQLWSESFEGDQSDLFALQDQVTARIGNSIGREMVIVAARESEARKSSPKVNDLILRARALNLRPLSLKNEQEQEDLYRQALALEPSNVSAMVGLAGSLVKQAALFGPQMEANIKEMKFVEGHDLASKAKELDPDNPSVYWPIGIYADAHGDFVGCRRAAETRLSLEPRNPAAYNGLALEFLFDGEPEKAIELLRQGISLDPRHPHEGILFNMGQAYFMLGDNDVAIEWFLKSLEKNPLLAHFHSLLAMAYANKGEDAKARAVVAKALRLDPNIKLSTFDEQHSARTAAYKEWFESKLAPAWRKAGLPE